MFQRFILLRNMDDIEFEITENYVNIAMISMSRLYQCLAYSVTE